MGLLLIGNEDYYSCPEDCNAPGECDAGFVSDCVDDDCCPESWIGDGFEDCEDQAYGCDLTCYDNDGGDCAGGTTTTTTTTTTDTTAPVIAEVIRVTTPTNDHTPNYTFSSSDDVQEKVTGAAKFGIDIRLPEMLFATVRQSPIFGESK